jgi:transcriptional regulator with XRE-family HTH domain
VTIIDPIYKEIGARIRAKRKKAHLKQENLAEMLHISRGSLANIEIGRQSVLVHRLYQIAAVLNLTPFELLPPPPTDDSQAEPTDLRIRGDHLNQQQLKQVTSFVSQVKTTQNPK